ncbi:hypothetical protein ICN48_06240 [Polynucleobacter sp. JS-Safj-400b-B2]|uniref:hypothetical protein n=1 Tax=Polynucleobacter sp. JS-Safj-400b-B2 TaxID=2576921 RepID=UPI001C0C40C2|nr:hypothetical protein [Polynucleobacter sp. JS-Safj-400b-B2]MBU3625831.1 hypothetical protein [Polynucleobacter sp. JS-Safj-400b-B2]
MKSKKIEVLFSYTENIIPKRCRHARPVRFEDGRATVSIPIVSKKDAPVAIIKNRCWDQAKPISYRWWGGKLWTKSSYENLPEQFDLNDNHASAINQSFGYYGSYNCSESKKERIKGIRAAAAKHLIIDGVYYERAGEPRYYVITFGMGRNHGGTSLSCSHHYNPNIGKSQYFSLLQLDQAIALASKTANARGDDKSLPIAYETFQVLIPEAIKVNPRKQHGSGCAFINSLNALSEAVGGNNAIVGAAVIGLALSA